MCGACAWPRTGAEVSGRQAATAAAAAGSCCHGGAASNGASKRPVSKAATMRIEDAQGPTQHVGAASTRKIPPQAMHQAAAWFGGRKTACPHEKRTKRQARSRAHTTASAAQTSRKAASTATGHKTRRAPCALSLVILPHRRQAPALSAASRNAQDGTASPSPGVRTSALQPETRAEACPRTAARMLRTAANDGPGPRRQPRAGASPPA